MTAHFTRSLLAAATAAALGGCASFLPAQQATVTPVERVGHSTGAAEGQYALGKYYLGQGRAALALVAFTKAIEYAPGHIEARNGKANALAQLGDLQAASRELQAAIARSPDSAHLYGNLGYIHLVAGRHAASAKALRRAFALDPRNANIRSNWAALAAAASTDADIARGLETDGRTAIAGLIAPASPPRPTAAAVREVIAQTVVNLAYADVSKPAAATAAGSLGVASNVEVMQIAPHSALRPTPQQSGAVIAPNARVAAPTSSQPRQSEAQTTVDGQETLAAAKDGSGTPGVPRPAPGKVASASAAIESPRPQEKAILSARLAVANGNGTPGMARRFGDRLRKEGAQVVRIANASTFTVERSVIHFREGHMQAALALSRRLDNRPAIYLDSSMPDHVDLQLVLGKDAAPAAPLVAALESTESSRTN